MNRCECGKEFTKLKLTINKLEGCHIVRYRVCMDCYSKHMNKGE